MVGKRAPLIILKKKACRLLNSDRKIISITLPGLRFPDHPLDLHSATAVIPMRSFESFNCTSCVALDKNEQQFILQLVSNEHTET